MLELSNEVQTDSSSSHPLDAAVVPSKYLVRNATCKVDSLCASNSRMGRDVEAASCKAYADIA